MKPLPKYQACHICGDYVKLKINFHDVKDNKVLRQTVRRCPKCGAFSEQLEVLRKTKKGRYVKL
jgi:hypothetical protein